MSKPLTWDEYKHQKAEVKFGAAVQFSEGVLESDEAVESCINMLAESVARGSHLQGYKVSEDKKLFMNTPSPFSLDPFNRAGSIGAKVRAELKVTPEKYLAYAQEKMKELVGALEDRSSWLGFLRWRLRADTIEDIEAGREKRLDRLGDELAEMANAIRKLQAEERDDDA